MERALERTGLLAKAAQLDRDQPLPTLGELISADTRLIVLAKEDGGSRPWYLDGFSFVHDTPLGATRPSQLRCRRSRGSADSPLHLVNHWIPPFPPSVRRNEPHCGQLPAPAPRELSAAPPSGAQPRGGGLPRAQRGGGGGRRPERPPARTPQPQMATFTSCQLPVAAVA